MGWLLAGAPAYAIERVVTVLVIACPHALGLAVPLVVAISTTVGARNGSAVRNRRGLEEARNLDAVVFDNRHTHAASSVSSILRPWTLSRRATPFGAVVERDPSIPSPMQS